MNFDFLDRRSAERFAELLDEDGAGPGSADARLDELVSIGRGMSAAKPGVRVDPEFRVGLRAMLVATAERDGIGRTSTAPTATGRAATARAATGRAATSRTITGTGRAAVGRAATRFEPVVEAAGPRLGILGRGGRRIRARGAIVLGVAAGALAVSGISAASENASPGDALYGVKRSTERAQLAMAGSDVTRGQLSLDFARTRLAEAVALPGDSAEFAGVLDDMDTDTRTGVKLLTTSAVAHTDTKPLDTVESFTNRQRQTLTPTLYALSTANRDRAQQSIGLLEDVQQRAKDLEAALNCHSITSVGSDTLGPRLKSCSAQTDGANTPSRTRTGRVGSKGSEHTQSPEILTPATTPNTTGSPSAAVTDATASPDDTASATPSVSTSGVTSSTGVDDRAPLGGVLNGILGTD